MTSVLVTGGAGYIGCVLCEMLLDAGHTVKVLDRMYFGREPLAELLERPGFEVVKEDIRYVGQAPFEGVDVVMHLAAISNDPSCDLDPEISNSINVEGTKRVGEMAKAAGVKRLIFSSSCSVYGHGQSELLTEESPKAPVSLYAKSKIEGEDALLAMQSPEFTVTVMRSGTAYGISPRMRFDLVLNIMTLYAYKRRRIFVLGQGQQTRPMVHISDIARAFMGVMDAPAEAVGGEIFNVGSSEQNFKVYRVAQMVRDVVAHTEVELVPDDPDKRDYNVSFEKIAKVLDFKVQRTPYEGCVEIKQALERGIVDDHIRTKTVEYYRYLLDAERLLRDVSREGAVF
jgi:nucleoside-diphosphate-sugar epimerase